MTISKINFVANGSTRKRAAKCSDPKQQLYPLKREQILQELISNPTSTYKGLSLKYGYSEKYVSQIAALTEFRARMKYLTAKQTKKAIWGREELFEKSQDLFNKTKSDNAKVRILSTLGKWNGLETSTINHEFADIQRIQLNLNGKQEDIPLPETTDDILSTDTSNDNV